jgi:5'-3' exonuclease
VKKANITTENVQEIMLSTIPGVSSKIAAALLDEYGSIKGLISELESNPERIQGLTIPVANGRRRRVPTTLPKTLGSFLCASRQGGIEVAEQEE